MPSFDRTSSAAIHRDGAALRAILGPPRPRATNLRCVAASERRRRIRQISGRALIVAIAAGLAAAPALISPGPTILNPLRNAANTGSVRVPDSGYGSRAAAKGAPTSIAAPSDGHGTTW